MRAPGLMSKNFAYSGSYVISSDVTFIRMEDMTRGFQLPCVMDLKIGQQTWEPNANLNKILKDSVKYLHVWMFTIANPWRKTLVTPCTSIHRQNMIRTFLFNEEVVLKYFIVEQGVSGGDKCWHYCCGGEGVSRSCAQDFRWKVNSSCATSPARGCKLIPTPIY